MAVNLREIHLKRLHRLELFRVLGDVEPLIERIRHRGREVAAKLERGRVWMLSSTATGGGVAEMLPTLVDLMHEVGIDARWVVLECDDASFFATTKALHNMIHGAAARLEGAAARAVYDAVSRQAAQALARVERGDILVVHDPQPAGVALHLRPEHRPCLIWRCHIGTNARNEQTRQAWEFLADYLAPYERCLFSAETYVPGRFAPRSGVVHPGIDPLSHKNRSLRPYKLQGILRAAGLLAGPPVPAWAQLRARARRYADGRWEESPIPALLQAPAILQVSRFDELKGFQHLIPSFVRMAELAPERVALLRGNHARMVWEIGASHLVLAGPDPSGVADDPEAAGVLERLCLQHDSLPPAFRERVHLLQLPMTDAKANALMVNALQRAASAVVQLSIKEGFGLTAAEAMWKETPIVASNVGGLAVQIRHGVDGLLVDDPTDPDAVAGCLIETLAQVPEAEARTCSARMRVREHFLVLEQVERWLEELLRAWERRREEGTG